MRSSEKYLQFARIGLRKSMVYRSDAIAGIATSIIYLGLMFYLWTGISNSGTLTSSFSEIISYIALGQVVSNATAVNLENQIGRKVRKGTVVNELKRPVSFRLQTVAFQVGRTLFKAVSRAAPIMLIAIAFLEVTVTGVIPFVLFVFSVGLSFVLAASISYATAMLTFWTKVGWSLRMIRSTVTKILSGVMFPLYLLPTNLEKAFMLTPFPSIVNTPIMIWKQGGLGIQTAQMLGTQIFWIAVSAGAGAVLWTKAKNKVTVQGG